MEIESDDWVDFTSRVAEAHQRGDLVTLRPAPPGGGYRASASPAGADADRGPDEQGG